MPSKVKGTVKWFSNRKGFGFISPTSDDAPTKEDIFVHQSSIVTNENYRTLKDGFEVLFEVATDENGKLKAVNVTSLDGSPCPPPEPRDRRRRKKKGDAENGDEKAADENTKPVTTEANRDGEKKDASDKQPKAENGEKKGGKNRRRKNAKKKGDDAKPKQEEKPATDKTDKPAAAKKQSWESELDESVKKALETKKIKVVAGKAFISIGDSSVKLGTGGYAAFMHASGVIAEGKFALDKTGKVSATWEKVLKVDGKDWKASDATTEKAVLLSDFNLTDDSVGPTKVEDAEKPVWGEDRSDPKEALEKAGFLMRKVAFDHGVGGRRRNRGRRNDKKKQGDQKNGETKK